jgi:hypothetical protein
MSQTVSQRGLVRNRIALTSRAATPSSRSAASASIIACVPWQQACSL